MDSITIDKPVQRLVEKNRNIPVWCPGCGDFGVLQALVRALQELGKTPNETVLVSGIGCSGRLPYFVDSYGFHTLHGRALPVATGVKLANPELTVVVMGGDGDGFGIGGGHIPHAARRNVDLTYIVMDNGVYGLTKGHSSPTTLIGQKTPSSRRGEESLPIDIIGSLLASRTSYVASTYSGDRPRLTEILTDAITHNGFSVVQVLSPCPTYNNIMSYDGIRADIKRVPEEHKSSDLIEAMRLHYENEGLIDGVIYRSPETWGMRGNTGTHNKETFNKLVERYV